jgi:hypothetical protein
MNDVCLVLIPILLLGLRVRMGIATGTVTPGQGLAESDVMTQAIGNYNRHLVQHLQSQ